MRRGASGRKKNRNIRRARHAVILKLHRINKNEDERCRIMMIRIKSVRTHMSGHHCRLREEGLTPWKKIALEPSKLPGLKNDTAMSIESEVILNACKVSHDRGANGRDHVVMCRRPSSAHQGLQRAREISSLSPSPALRLYGCGPKYFKSWLELRPWLADKKERSRRPLKT